VIIHWHRGVKSASLTGRLFALVLLALALAWSQQPSPSEAVVRQDQKNATTADQKKAEPSDASAENISSLADKVLAEIDSRKKQEHASEADKSTPRDYGRLTDWLILIVMAIQAWIYWKQTRVMNQSLIETKKSADAATNAAVTASAQIAAMETQSGYMRDSLAETKKAADAAARSARAAEAALYTSHRPFVFIEQVQVKAPWRSNGYRSSLNERIRYSPLEIKFFNSSDTPALDFYYSIYVVAPGISHPLRVTERRTLPPRDGAYESIEWTELMQVGNDLFDQMEREKAWIAGFIRYKSIAPEIPGSYVAFDFYYDNSIGEFRVGLHLKEDGPYPQPAADQRPDKT